VQVKGPFASELHRFPSIMIKRLRLEPVLWWVDLALPAPNGLRYWRLARTKFRNGSLSSLRKSPKNAGSTSRQVHAVLAGFLMREYLNRE